MPESLLDNLCHAVFLVTKDSLYYKIVAHSFLRVFFIWSQNLFPYGFSPLVSGLLFRAAQNAFKNSENLCRGPHVVSCPGSLLTLGCCHCDVLVEPCSLNCNHAV